MASPRIQLKTNETIVSAKTNSPFVMPSSKELGLTSTEMREGVEAIRELLAKDGLPTLMTNRNADDALRVLEFGEFSTIHTILKFRNDLAPELQKQFKAAAVTRKRVEERRGTYGAGKTVYASVHLGTEIGSERTLTEVDKNIGRGRETKPAQGFYLAQGAVTFEMKPQVLEKSTFLGCDSFKENNWTPGTSRHLPEVMLSALARIAGQLGETDVLKKILEQPSKKRQELLRRAFDSDLFQWDYIEAQMRSPSRNDIQCIRIKQSVKGYPDGYLADGTLGTHAQVVRKIRAKAKALGIPVIEIN